MKKLPGIRNPFGPWASLSAIVVTVLVATGCNQLPGSGEDPGEFASTCIDVDNDGFGDGCALGSDCNDSDPSVTNQCYRCIHDGIEGCSCSEPGKQAACGVQRTSLDRPICGLGVSTCSEGVWSACAVDRFESFFNPDNPPSFPRPAALPTTGVSCDAGLADGAVVSGACDPYCFTFNDSLDGGIDAIADVSGMDNVALGEGGITIVQIDGGTADVPDAPSTFDAAEAGSCTNATGGCAHSMCGNGGALNPFCDQPDANAEAQAPGAAGLNGGYPSIAAVYNSTAGSSTTITATPPSAALSPSTPVPPDTTPYTATYGASVSGTCENAAIAGQTGPSSFTTAVGGATCVAASFGSNITPANPASGSVSTAETSSTPGTWKIAPLSATTVAATTKYNCGNATNGGLGAVGATCRRTTVTAGAPANTTNVFSATAGWVQNLTTLSAWSAYTPTYRVYTAGMGNASGPGSLTAQVIARTTATNPVVNANNLEASYGQTQQYFVGGLLMFNITGNTAGAVVRFVRTSPADGPGGFGGVTDTIDYKIPNASSNKLFAIEVRANGYVTAQVVSGSATITYQSVRPSIAGVCGVANKPACVLGVNQVTSGAAIGVFQGLSAANGAEQTSYGATGTYAAPPGLNGFTTGNGDYWAGDLSSFGAGANYIPYGACGVQGGTGSGYRYNESGQCCAYSYTSSNLPAGTSQGSETDGTGRLVTNGVFDCEDVTFGKHAAGYPINGGQRVPPLYNNDNGTYGTCPAGQCCTYDQTCAADKYPYNMEGEGHPLWLNPSGGTLTNPLTGANPGICRSYASCAPSGVNPIDTAQCNTNSTQTQWQNISGLALGAQQNPANPNCYGCQVNYTLSPANGWQVGDIVSWGARGDYGSFYNSEIDVYVYKSTTGCSPPGGWGSPIIASTGYANSSWAEWHEGQFQFTGAGGANECFLVINQLNNHGGVNDHGQIYYATSSNSSCGANGYATGSPLPWSGPQKNNDTYTLSAVVNPTYCATCGNTAPNTGQVLSQKNGLSCCATEYNYCSQYGCSDIATYGLNTAFSPPQCCPYTVNNCGVSGVNSASMVTAFNTNLNAVYVDKAPGSGVADQCCYFSNPACNANDILVRNSPPQGGTCYHCDTANNWSHGGASNSNVYPQGSPALSGGTPVCQTQACPAGSTACNCSGGTCTLSPTGSQCCTLTCGTSPYLTLNGSTSRCENRSCAPDPGTIGSGYAAGTNGCNTTTAGVCRNPAANPNESATPQGQIYCYAPPSCTKWVCSQTTGCGSTGTSSCAYCCTTAWDQYCAAKAINGCPAIQLTNGQPTPLACSNGDDDGDGYSNAVDCRPCDPLVNQGAFDFPNNVDDDCDGQTDNGQVSCDTGLTVGPTLTGISGTEAIGLCQYVVNTTGSQSGNVKFVQENDAGPPWGVINYSATSLPVVDAGFTVPAGGYPAAGTVIRPTSEAGAPPVFTKADNTTTLPTAGNSARDGKAAGVWSQFGTNTYDRPKEGSRILAISSGTAIDQPDFAAYGGVSPQNSPMNGYWRECTSSSYGNCFGVASTTLPAGFPAAGTNAGCPQSSKFWDSVSLRFQVRVPSNAVGVSFNTQWFTAEYPEWLCSSWNDAFVGLIDSARISPTDSHKKNVIFDTYGNPVTVNLAASGTGQYFPLPGPSVTYNHPALAGTGFDGLLYNSGGVNQYSYSKTILGGSTGWLTTQAPVLPGEIMTMRFLLWDTGDGIFDSTALVDNWQWLPRGTPIAAPTTTPDINLPPAVYAQAATFDRDYCAAGSCPSNTCPPGTTPSWKTLTWTTTTPAGIGGGRNSSIELWVSSAPTLGELATTGYPLRQLQFQTPSGIQQFPVFGSGGVTDAGSGGVIGYNALVGDPAVATLNYGCGGTSTGTGCTTSNGVTSQFTGASTQTGQIDLNASMRAVGVGSNNTLRVSFRLYSGQNASAQNIVAPTINDWNVTFDCLPQ